MKNTKLKNIINETIDSFLKKRNTFVFDIDVSEIPIEILKKGYFDYRLVPTSVSYTDVLCNETFVMEAVRDVLPPDTIVNNIVQKYHIPKELVVKIEHHHQIYIYAITAMIGVNDKLITEDMEKMGYFMSYMGGTQNVGGMKYAVLQFEPTSQLQEDVTEAIKEKYKVLYHWTPYYNVDSIFEKGLIPSHKNTLYNFPSRTYLIKGDTSNSKLVYFGMQLCAKNEEEKNDGKYALLKIDLNKLDEAIRFFFDPNSDVGIYTQQIIPKEAISIEGIKLLK